MVSVSKGTINNWNPRDGQQANQFIAFSKNISFYFCEYDNIPCVLAIVVWKTITKTSHHVMWFDNGHS